MLRFSLGLLAAGVLFGQTFNARITGTVKDPTDASVPNATVTATQIGTNVRKSAKSDRTGVYNIPLLLPGEYEVSVEAAGFASQVRKDIRLEVNQTVTLDFTITPASVATTVDVTAETPLLQTETSGLGHTVETKLIEAYPLPQRDVMGVLRLLPGVVAGSQIGDARGNRNVFNSNFSVAGGRTSTNEVLLDGAPNTIGDFNGVAVAPPPDSVQELRVETAVASAEFGRTGGGVVNMITKSGTNELHGTAFYDHQNDFLNANGFSNNRNGIGKPVLRRHQWGGTAGGPVVLPKLYNGKDRTFFFFAYEGRLDREPAQGLYSVPTQKEMNGDFSETVTIVNNQPQLVRIFDPFTSRIVNGVRTRDPFPGNVVPPSRINPIAKRVLQEYPAPNRPGDPFTNRRNYFYQDTNDFTRRFVSGRVDHYLKPEHRLFARFSWQRNLLENAGNIVQFAPTTSTLDRYRNFAIDDTYTFTPSVSNVLRYSYTRYHANIYPTTTLGFDPTTLGLPSYIRDSANVSFYPNFSFGFTAIGGTAYNNQPRDTQGVQETILWTRGRHQLRLGAEWRLYRFYPFQVFNPTGSYTFGANFTQQDHLAAGRPTEGFGLASFLLGTGNFTYEHVEPLSAFSHYWAAFVQDDWKVTSRLTLNLGLRWETETGTAEAHDRLTYFDPNARNPLRNGPPGALLFAGGGNPRGVREPNLKNFGPRVGLAYRISNRMSVRAGYGIFYLPLGLEPTLGTTPFNYSVPADVVSTEYKPRVTLSDPFPGGPLRPELAARVTDGSYRLGQNSNVVLRDQPAPYMQEWNFGISRQVSRTMVVDATYFGTRGIHLPIPNMELNQIHPDLLKNGGAWLNERVPNPYYGQITSGLLAQPTIPRMQLLKPFPQFANPATANAYGGSLLYFRPPVGDSIYHGATFKVERRFSQGLSVFAHYTVSKLIDIGGVGNGNAFNDPSALRDIYNIRLERSLSAWDVPQRLVVSYSYELPFGKGKRFAVNNPILDRVIGGWTLMSIHSWERGRPVAVGGPDLSRIAGAGPSRVTVVPGVKAEIPLEEARRRARDWSPVCNCTPPWFNTAAFTTTPEFVLPNGPRFLPDVRQDNPRNWDLSLDKRIRINERFSATLQARFYNVLNQVYFAAPNGSVTSNTFGSVGVGSAPRRGQIGAKITF